MKFADLNSEQRQAVEHTDGPMLVVAGAGTGKTQVITQRIARLISEGNAKPEEILALTFTEKAANEMLDRLDNLIGWQAYRVNAMTFHAFGAQVLRRFGHHIGWPTSAEVLTDLTKVLLVKSSLDKLKLEYYGNQQSEFEFLQSQLRFIESLQSEGISSDEYGSYIESIPAADIRHPLDKVEAVDRLKIYRHYEALKKQKGVIDYHDQIELSLRILQQKPNISERLRQQFKYVLVDEYQDTDTRQDALLKELVPEGGNIFVVGDDDQAIYGFRGARLANILQFAEYYQVSRPVVLHKNYRSVQTILDMSYRMIQHNNPNRLEFTLSVNKRLLSTKLDSDQPEIRGFADAAGERRGIAEAIRQHKGPLAEMAVLATSHAPLKALARLLRKEGVPYRLSTSVNVFEQAEMIQLWHLIKWLVFTASDESILQLLMGPYFEVSTETVRLAADTINKSGLRAEAAIEQCSRDKPALKEVLKKLVQWRQWVKDLTASQAVYNLIFETGMSDKWVKMAEDNERIVRLFGDLQAWLQQLQQYEEFGEGPSLASYVIEFPKPPEISVESMQGDENGVALLTIHASKGLEFDSVIVMNNTLEAWTDRTGFGVIEVPESLIKNELPPEHEWRRLLYVAITRAKYQLLFTLPMIAGNHRSRRLSPFLSELFTKQELENAAKSASLVNGLDKSLQEIQRFAPKMEVPKLVALPFEDSAGWLVLNATDIDRYNYCPYEFYIEKVLGIRSFVGPQQMFGQVLHGLFHDFYSARLMDEQLTAEDLTQRLVERWSSEGFESIQHAEAAFAVAQKTLENFIRRESNEKDRQLVATEDSFVLALPEIKLRLKGRMDAVYRLASGGLEVRDFKTGGRRNQERLDQVTKENLQLRTYAMAMKERTGQLPELVSLDYVVTGMIGQAKMTSKIMQNHRDKLQTIAESIHLRHFKPSNNATHNCIAHRYWGTMEEDDET